jgi:uncharacterized DUF497 family protein
MASRSHGLSRCCRASSSSGKTSAFDYGKTRMIAIGEIGGREFVCIYTRRGDAVRPISLRRADRKERHAYQEAKAAAEEA